MASSFWSQKVDPTASPQFNWQGMGYATQGLNNAMTSAKGLGDSLVKLDQGNAERLMNERILQYKTQEDFNNAIQDGSFFDGIKGRVSADKLKDAFTNKQGMLEVDKERNAYENQQAFQQFGDIRQQILAAAAAGNQGKVNSLLQQAAEQGANAAVIDSLNKDAKETIESRARLAKYAREAEDYNVTRKAIQLWEAALQNYGTDPEALSSWFHNINGSLGTNPLVMNKIRSLASASNIDLGAHPVAKDSEGSAGYLEETVATMQGNAPQVVDPLSRSDLLDNTVVPEVSGATKFNNYIANEKLKTAGMTNGYMPNIGELVGQLSQTENDITKKFIDNYGKQKGFNEAGITVAKDKIKQIAAQKGRSLSDAEAMFIAYNSLGERNWSDKAFDWVGADNDDVKLTDNLRFDENKYKKNIDFYINPATRSAIDKVSSLEVLNTKSSNLLAELNKIKEKLQSPDKLTKTEFYRLKNKADRLSTQYAKLRTQAHFLTK